VLVADRIQNNIVRVPIAGCWLWLMSVGSHGYGQLNFPDKKPRLVHRLSYEQYVGAIPDGLHVLHHCDVRSCCNPEHLFVGTAKDNMRDCMKKGRNSAPPLGANWKLTPAQRNDMVSRYRSGERADSLAAEYGVHHSRVYQLNRAAKAVLPTQ
jgi:hypothetical protein